GRVSFMPLSAPGAEAPPRPNRLIEASPLVQLRMPLAPGGRPDHPGVVALAADLVACDDPLMADLPRRLLGRTLVVRDLDTARAVAAHASGYRFVTLAGELLEADGTLSVGLPSGETGLLSRKSKLRELREEIASQDGRLVEVDADLQQLARQAEGAD